MASHEKKKTIAVKFSVDKEKSRVLYAEADKDFVDVLFSFLTLPLGTIVRVLHKQSSLGCIDNLYESVEKLDIQHLQTEACKTMLLHPQSEAALYYEDLKLNVDDTKPRDVYVCKNDDCCLKQLYFYKNDVCCLKQTCLFSSVQNARCIYCKGTMGRKMTLPKREVELFVKKGVKYVISDDLHVQPASANQTLSLLRKMDIIKSCSVLEERHMDLGIDEILALLKRSLVSTTPLTDFYYNKDANDVIATHDLGERENIKVKTEPSEDTNSEGISVKLLVNKDNRRVLCAEVGEDFLNQLLGFLTLPLGSLIEFLDKSPTIRCVDSLYASIENSTSDYIESKECRSMLLSPKLAPFYGCSNSILKLDESKPQELWPRNCFTCYQKSVSCQCSHRHTALKELNPKSPQGSTEKGGGYAKGPGTFSVSDNLFVTQFSTSSTIRILGERGSSFINVVEKEAIVGEVQVLKLLRAAMSSTTPLTDVFSPVRI